jgi:ElaB/YqjD/DUF883 family membrane-anchored ribosome-binding protein
MQSAKTYPHNEGGNGRRGQGTAGEMAEQVADKAAEYAGKAGEQIERAVEGADATIRSVAEHGREAGERVQEVAGNFKSAVNKSVKDQPMATLAVVGALGFVLGALWKS